MKKMMLVGRSECGKTTLSQALKGEKIGYHKTQYINYHDILIDTPGEYAETKVLGRALALYSYEADVVGMLISAREQYSQFPPCCTAQVNREVVGIVTQIDQPDANVERAAGWLELAGCKLIFPVSSTTGEGIQDLIDYLAVDRKPQKFR